MISPQMTMGMALFTGAERRISRMLGLTTLGGGSSMSKLMIGRYGEFWRKSGRSGCG